MVESRWPIAVALLCSMLALLPCAACKSEKSDDTADSTQPLASDEYGDSGERAARRRKRELPRAAFDACQDKGLGDACTVTVGERPIAAKCSAVPDGRLACPPEPGAQPKPK